MYVYHSWMGGLWHCFTNINQIQSCSKKPGLQARANLQKQQKYGAQIILPMLQHLGISVRILINGIARIFLHVTWIFFKLFSGWSWFWQPMALFWCLKSCLGRWSLHIPKEEARQSEQPEMQGRAAGSCRSCWGDRPIFSVELRPDSWGYYWFTIFHNDSHICNKPPQVKA